MPAPESILKKVKLLLNLANSPNQNEADNARTLADKLIAKYNITEDELASLEEKVFYGEDEKLFTTLGVVGWRQQLALAVATYFDCQIVQEELAPNNGGISEFNYFVYGDDDQVKDTQFVFHAFCNKVLYLIETRCIGRGEIYIGSYCEGIVESIRWNIQMYGIELPEIGRSVKKEVAQAAPPTSKSITKADGTKEEPTDKRVNINSQSFIKDVMAYFKGVEDGKDLSLKDILELAVQNETSKELSVTGDSSSDGGG